jgi:hypothetical protein
VPAEIITAAAENEQPSRTHLRPRQQRQLATALAARSPLVAGPLVQHAGGAWATGAFAATMTVAVVLCLVQPGLRQPDNSSHVFNSHVL